MSRAAGRRTPQGDPRGRRSAGCATSTGSRIVEIAECFCVVSPTTPATLDLGPDWLGPGARNPTPIVLSVMRNVVVSRDRDRILEQALKHELRAPSTPSAGLRWMRKRSAHGRTATSLAAMARGSARLELRAVPGSCWHTAARTTHRHLRHAHGRRPGTLSDMEMVAGADRR